VATYTSGHDINTPPDLRILHFNDVYHLDPSSAEPAGGVARFVTLCKEYREAERFRGQPELVTLFSGDVFNPSLESSITKGPSLIPGHHLGFPSSYDSVQAATWFRFST
jgi:2',3'-cyclic-nucleotide 2'-phosphodiesterase (5'-nucleotidase family)